MLDKRRELVAYRTHRKQIEYLTTILRDLPPDENREMARPRFNPTEHGGEPHYTSIHSRDVKEFSSIVDLPGRPVLPRTSSTAASYESNTAMKAKHRRNTIVELDANISQLPPTMQLAEIRYDRNVYKTVDPLYVCLALSAGMYSFFFGIICFGKDGVKDSRVLTL